MGGFDMGSEKRHSEKGRTILETVLKGMGREGSVLVPRMYDATDNVLLMEFINGRTLAKGAVAPNDFLDLMSTIYVVMISVYGFWHQDMHKGNIMILDSCVYLLDWGEVVEVPVEHQEDVKLLMKYVVHKKWHGSSSDSLRQLFTRLGVQTKPGKPDLDENFEELANLLDIPQALRADPEEASNTMVKASSFESPGWLEAWQKATNALAISFQGVQATPDMVDKALNRALDWTDRLPGFD
jgi:predicted unusual protein kinase regulating ubiquinone biosynthesis (AarF/ABC1/UbiB family)